MKVGYQGIKGAYSEAAIYKHFKENVESVGFETFEDVFDAVENGVVDYGFLPFENTIAGSVVMNYDLLLNKKVKIIAEVFLKIRHCLLSHKDNDLENVKRIYSHPHSIEQCRKFIKTHNLKAIPEYDTAGSAKIIKDKKNSGDAAIASELCAEIYGLDILEKDIQTNQNNMTKFFVFVKEDNVSVDLKKEKTSIAFKVKHYAGSLVNSLQRLSKNDINLTKLESRPLPDNPWEYVFYADFEAGVDKENVKLALSEIEATTTFIKVLGSYPKGKE